MRSDIKSSTVKNASSSVRILTKSPVRKIVIAGNWKMFKTQAESEDFLRGFLPHLEETPSEREVVLCPPFTDLSVISKYLHGSRIQLGRTKRPLGRKWSLHR